MFLVAVASSPSPLCKGRGLGRGVHSVAVAPRPSLWGPWGRGWGWGGIWFGHKNNGLFLVAVASSPSPLPKGRGSGRGVRSVAQVHRKKVHEMKRFVGIWLPIALILAWSLASFWKIIDPLFLPPPWAVAKSLWAGLAHGSLPKDFTATV